MNLEKLSTFFKDGREYKIIGREAHLNAGVIVLFCEINGEIFILFEKRSEKIKQGGEICFPGGKRDKEDKNFLETALRETYEEIGLSKDKIINTRRYGSLIIPIGVVVETSIGYVPNFKLDDLNLNKDEVEEIILVPFEYFLTTEPEIEYVIVENQPFYEDKSGERKKFCAEKWGLPKKYKKPWAGNPRRIVVYSYENNIIWGITGEIIYSIAKNFKG